MISVASHNKLLVPSVSDVSLLHMAMLVQPRQFCETSAEVSNYVIVFFLRLCGKLGQQKLNVDVSPFVYENNAWSFIL